MSPPDLSSQAKRPDLSLLEVLKELASQWNDMSRQEKQKFAVIAKESEDKQELSAISFATQEAGEDRGEKEEEEVEGEEDLVTGRDSRRISRFPTETFCFQTTLPVRFSFLSQTAHHC